jgi:N-acetyltransferase 10
MSDQCIATIIVLNINIFFFFICFCTSKGDTRVHEARWEAAAAAAAATTGTSASSPLVELELLMPIRYAQGDPVESWLNKLLCLDCGSEASLRLNGGAPAPSDCELYHVNRDALFSYHKLSEAFLQKLMGLYTSAHYKNTPNDLQMLSDAPSHAVFVLLSPTAEEQDADSLPDILAVVQVALEGRISRKAVEAQLARGHRSAGDLIPWTISQQFGDSNFAQLSGARIVRIAVHPKVQGMGYGSRAIELLYRYYNGEMVNLSSNNANDDEDSDSESSDDDAKEKGSGDESEDEDENMNDESVSPSKSNGKGGIQNEKLKPRKDLPPLLLPLTEVKAPRLDWLGTSFGLTRGLFQFWQRADMHLLYLRQTKNELTGEHSAILCRALPRRTGFDDAWLPAFAGDSRRRIISMLSGSFATLEVKVATSILGDLSAIHRQAKEEDSDTATSKAIAVRSGSPSSALTSSELNYYITPHDLKRLELYGRNLCDHHLITDLLAPVARLYFTGRFGNGFALSNLQTALLCGIGLQNKSVDAVAKELALPLNQVLAMFNKAIRKVSIALQSVIEEEEKSKLLSGSARIEAEKTAERMKHVPRQTLEEDVKEGAKEAMAQLKGQSTNYLPPELAADADLRSYTIKGTDSQWDAALKNNKDADAGNGEAPSRVQIESLKKNSAIKRKKLDQEDIDKEMKAEKKLRNTKSEPKKKKKKSKS